MGSIVAPETQSRFADLELLPYDEAYIVQKSFVDDPSPDKITLGAGVYRDENAKPWTLPSVKLALSRLPDVHDYLPSEGFPPFVQAARELLFGSLTAELSPRLATIQTIAGTGACHVGTELLIRLQRKPTAVWIADPTWINHSLIWTIAADDVEQKRYPYYDAAKRQFDFQGTIAALRTAQSGDVVILQTCSQNPTGNDPSQEQWKELADVVQERGLFPFFDNAYQGFASGDPDVDAWAIRHFASRPGMELGVAQSFSKNMGLYGERLGAFHLLLADPAILPAAQANLVRVLRGSVSSTVSFAARAVAAVLTEDDLRTQWRIDLRTITDRIQSMRKALRSELEVLGTPGTWGHITDQLGMFSYTGLTRKQVEVMASKYHIYMLPNGRISVPGCHSEMAPDIRSFFGPKGGAAAPAKAAPKEDVPAKKGRSSRKVLEDSDEDDIVEYAKCQIREVDPEPEQVKGVEVSANEYFSSEKAKPSKSRSNATNPDLKNASKTDIEIRLSPRKKDPEPARPSAAASTKSTPTKKGRAVATKKRTTTAYKSHNLDDDDAFVDDDEDGGDDIFAADTKSSKRKNDDYVEDESDEDDFMPNPKRVASRAKAAAASVKISDDEESDVKPKARAGRGTKATNDVKGSTRAATAKAGRTSSVAGKKRKTPEPEESDLDILPVPKPRKKPATATKAQAAPMKDKTENGLPSSVQAILASIPTVRPPTPPPTDTKAKFNWRKAAGGGGNSTAPPNAGAVELPEGAPNCLVGQTFVFTGLLQTISRDEGQALVKRYGGKVTTAPSRNTSWVVLGDDAGPSKLAKISQLSLRTIDENGLFELIKRLPAGGGDSKEAEKARQKQEKDEEKIKEAAEEMEREEEARRLEAEKAQKVAAKVAEKAASASGKGGSSNGKDGASRSQAAPARVPTPTAQQLWTTKYAPTQLNQICGNKAQVERIASWLKNWPKAKKYDFMTKGADGLGASRAIIISGPPGIGKTTAAHLAANLADHDVIETNASDTRSKKLVESGIGDTMDNTSLLGFFAPDGKKVDTTKKNVVLIMDEVDGMSAGDRGGIGALAKFCKKTEVPLILICNERRLPKMRPFDHVAFDLRFNRPTVDQIRSRVMTICHREGLKLPPTVVDALIEGTNKDIRQIINMLSTAKLDQSTMTYDQGKAMTKAWEKHVVLKPWDICQKMLGGGLFAPASKATLNDKIELYFNDHEFSYLMIQENYLNTKPMALSSSRGNYTKREERLKYLELVDNAAQSISDGDLVDRMIHGPQQQWSLMPTHAVFSTVRPASFVSGQLMGSNFTSWLGNNSKTGKLSRYVREIHSHMRLKASGDHNEVRQQYLPVLWHQLIKRMELEGKEAIDEVIELMDSYYLTREDVDAIKELGLGPQSEDTVKIDTQAKSAFTRTYNGMPHPIPFMKASNVTVTAKRSAHDVPDLEEAIEEEDDADVAEPVEVDEDELDLKTDKYIKQPKAKAKRAPKKAAAKNVDDDEEGSAKGRGKGKTAAAKKGSKAKK
ncbi:DNA replication factor c subunit [Grosmannia clavigera kw1407]|uniref:Aspartate aminotransferase n=1 Tax=Grosmannia clavigera (strain kw1407 / UAMH 11150) TaxID=655863 RepID=F0XTY5_GROCL|nr:DNA replication factor c subunit [Grosmannia clavigera kw1407]EFW98951.1 DNA replication factor c subunit [Grosmannia clavigera kw1407]